MKNQSFQPNRPIDLMSLLAKTRREPQGLQSITIKVYKKQEYIYCVGAKSEEVYIVKEGRVKIGNQAENARTIIKNVVMMGELFGEASLMDKTARFDFAIAMEDTELYVLSLEELYRQMQHQSSLTTYIINLFGARLIASERKMESFLFKSSRTRIIDFLTDLAKKRGQRVGYEILVRNFFTHQEIADITATSRQTVTSVLNELRNKNILNFNRRRLLIRDLLLLRAEEA